jgi:sarcosine oxidase gamma subunit
LFGVLAAVFWKATVVLVPVAAVVFGILAWRSFRDDEQRAKENEAL